jgi:hypothetical protein
LIVNHFILWRHRDSSFIWCLILCVNQRMKRLLLYTKAEKFEILFFINVQPWTLILYLGYLKLLARHFTLQENDILLAQFRSLSQL